MANDPGDRMGALGRSALEANQAGFLKAIRSRRFAFTATKWLYLVVFLTALGTMLAAVRLAGTEPEAGYDWAHAGVVAGIAAMSVLLFAVLLYVRPLSALERNAVVEAFLTVVVNSYWTRMLEAEAGDDPEAMRAATAATVEHLAALLDRQVLGASRFMDVVRRTDEEDGLDPEAYRSPV